MSDIPPLGTLGRRIWISGPSGGGKSTLAVAIGRALDLPVIHLDRLRFVIGTYAPRPVDAFAAAVRAAESSDAWVMDGNWFTGMASRLPRTTGLINLHTPPLGNYLRYLRRTLPGGGRQGRVVGASERLSWKMTRWILWDEPRNWTAKRQRLRETGLPLVETNSIAELNALYRNWELEQPS